MNKLYAMLSLLGTLSFASHAEVINIQSKGNLEAPNPADCVAIDKLLPTQNPADIFRGMKQCLNAENYSDAAKMYFAAMTYGVYDTKRVRDKTSHQGIIVLRMNTLAGLSKQQISLLQSEVKAILASNEQVCAALSARGMPSYHPNYMIQHGMGAFSGSQGADGLVESFDSQSAWSEVMSSTAKCKES